MSRRKKKNKDISAEPVGSFIPAHDEESNLKPSKAAKQKKHKKGKSKAKKSKQKQTKSSKKSKSKKKGNKKPKKSKISKSETKSKSSKTKTKNKNKKDKKSKTNKNKNKNQRNRAKTTANKSTDKPKKKNKKRKNTETTPPKSKSKDIQLNDISHTPQKNDKTPTKVKQFPWDNWKIDDNDDSKTDDESYGSHRIRRSSLGSVRELHMANVARAKKVQLSGKKGGGHRSHRKHKSKKHKKHKNTMDYDEKVDIYDPKDLKKKRKKEKEKKEFKVVPKHHVKRSSLPTYQSIRKNNPKLQFFVKKETERNLATLLDQPEKRKKSKQLKNLSRNGFDLHVNKRYRLEDGRVGVCKYKGRTEFGKSSEDWIGLVLDIGEGEHDGSVQGRSYFRCRMGKGLFVRPYDIIQDMGSKNKMLKKDDIKLAKAHIKRYKKMKSSTTTSSDVIEKDEYGNAINPDHGNLQWEKFYNPKTLLDKNKGKKAAKKKHHTQV